MSANCPPQLQLSIDIQPSTTSFKRSFEQFGFDLDSPVITGPEDLVAATTELDTAAMDGNVEGRSTGIGLQQQNGGRRGNKRPRSASSFSSESSSSASASTSSGRSGLRSEASSSASSTSSPPTVHHPSSIRPQNRTRIQLLSPSPPRLPTPEIQDIEMPAEYATTTESAIGDDQHNSNPALLIPLPTTTHAAHASSTSFVPQVHHSSQPHPASSSSPPSQQQQPTPDDMFRLSLERFNAFDTEISALRQPDNPASLSLSLGLGLMPISNSTGGMRAGTTRLISPTPLSVDRRRSRTPPPTLPLLPIQVEAEEEDESAIILPEVIPTATMTTAPVAAVALSSPEPSSSSSSSPISSSHNNRGAASSAISTNTTTNTLDFHVPTSPFADHFFLQEGFVNRSGEEEGAQVLRTGALVPTHEVDDDEFEENEEEASSRFREHLQEHLRDRRRPRMPFRDRLDTALARLRSRSPLVPGIGDASSSSSEASGERESEESEEGRSAERDGDHHHWEDATEHEEEEEEERLEEYDHEQVVVPPPTLPPIPTIATASTSAQDLWEGEFLSNLERGDMTTTSTTTTTTTRTRTPSTAVDLSDHPLPSPRLRDLHSWIEGDSGPNVGGGADGTSERHDAHTITNSNLNTTTTTNSNIHHRPNVAGTSNNTTAARPSSPSTSTTSTSTVRPSSVTGGFAGFAAFGGPSEMSASSHLRYHGLSIPLDGTSGMGEAEELRSIDTRFGGPPHHHHYHSQAEAQAAMAAAATRPTSRLRTRESWSPPPLPPQRFIPLPPWNRNLASANQNATTSNAGSSSNANSSTSTMAANANTNTATSSSSSPDLYDFLERIGPIETFDTFANWSSQRTEDTRFRRPEQAGEEREEEEEGEERDEDEDEVEDEDERDRRLRAEILSTRRLPRPEEFSAGFSSSLSGAVGESQSRNQDQESTRDPMDNLSPQRATARSDMSRSRSFQRSMRPGASNSLVTESAAEVRRRVDRAQAEEWASGRRRDPPARSPWAHLEGILSAEGGEQLRESAWGTELLERIGATDQNRRSRSRSPPDRRRRLQVAPLRAADDGDLPWAIERVGGDPATSMDETEDRPRRNSDVEMTDDALTFESWLATQPVPIPRSPPPRTPILDFFSRPNYFPRHEAVAPTEPPPSLPSPDLGGSFDSDPQPPTYTYNPQAPLREDRQFYPSNLWRPHYPETSAFVPPSSLPGVSNDRSDDRDVEGNNSSPTIPPTPRPPFIDPREDDSDDDTVATAYSVLEGLQRTIDSMRSLPSFPRPQVEPRPSRSTIPSYSHFSPDDYTSSTWMGGAGNASGAGRTQREPTSSNAPPPPSTSPTFRPSFTLDTFDPSSFAPGPFRNTVQQLVDERERDRLRGTAPSSSSISIPITSQPAMPSHRSSFTTELFERTRPPAPPPRLGQTQLRYHRPPNPHPPSIPPLSFGGDEDAGGRASEMDMDVVDMGFSPSSPAASSRPTATANTADNMNASRARRFSSYARGLGSAIPITTFSPEVNSSNAGRDWMNTRESYGRRSFVPELRPSSSSFGNTSSSRVGYPPPSSAASEMRHINAHLAETLNMARANAARSNPAATSTDNTNANTTNNNRHREHNPLLQAFPPYTAAEAAQRRQLLQRHNFDRLRLRERERERDARASSTATNSTSGARAYRPGFFPPRNNTSGPTTTGADAAAAARMALADDDRRERLLALQSHTMRARRGQFAILSGGTAAGGANSSSSNNTRSSSGGFSSASSNIPPQHQHPRTLQNFQHWHDMQTEAAGWVAAGGDVLGGRRGRGGRARVLGDYMRDEDFDESYESLISLAATLGEAKPRAAPSEIVEKMEKAKYKDWKTEESDVRCPICLDDYEPDDPVLKLNNCSHWLHSECLHQWLETASTCPVCRKSVNNNTSSGSGPSFGRRHFHLHHVHHRHPFGTGPGVAGMGLGARRRERETTDRQPPSGPVPRPGGREELERRLGLAARFGTGSRTAAGRSSNGRGGGGGGSGGSGGATGDGGNSANANEQSRPGNNDDRWGAHGWGDGWDEL